MNNFDLLLERNNIALVLKENLKPVEGYDTVIFPPTYARMGADDRNGYNIDELTAPDNTVIGNICQIDSVGSQANRMEPVFKEAEYKDLIPDYKVEIPNYKAEIKETEKTIHILDAGHRIADAVFRMSDLGNEITKAFKELEKGNYEPLAKMAPTSIVFGCWDSRGTQVKIPRIVRSVIRAYNVNEIHRSAQFFTSIKNYREKVDKEIPAKKKDTDNPLSSEGLNDNPVTGQPGGVSLLPESRIIREAVLSLSALRRVRSPDPEQSRKLQRYILGLALVAITARQDPFLRMGCELTPDPAQPGTWELITSDGKRQAFDAGQPSPLEYAKKVADDFGVGSPGTAIFNKKKARKKMEKPQKKKGNEE